MKLRAKFTLFGKVIYEPVSSILDTLEKSAAIGKAVEIEGFIESIGEWVDMDKMAKHFNSGRTQCDT